MEKYDNLDSLSQDLLDLIDKEIANAQSQQTQIRSGIIDSVNSDGRVSLHLPPDNTIFNNVQNQSVYRMKKGLSVKVLRENNTSNNMWVIGVFNESSDNVSKRFVDSDFSQYMNGNTNEIVNQRIINGGGGSQEEEIDLTKVFTALFYQPSEVLLIKNISLNGFISKEGTRIHFMLPLTKSTMRCKSLTIETLKMSIFQFGETLISKNTVISSTNPADGYEIYVTSDEFFNGYLNIIIDRFASYNDGIYIDNSNCVVLLEELRITFSSFPIEVSNDYEIFGNGEKTNAFKIGDNQGSGPIVYDS